MSVSDHPVGSDCASTTVMSPSATTANAEQRKASFPNDEVGTAMRLLLRPETGHTSSVSVFETLAG
jgi:hypothetical protein